MKRDEFQATPPADVTAVQDGERWTLVFTRELRHAPEEVWRALTESEELRAWSPFDSDRDLDEAGAEVTLSVVGADEASAGRILRADAPHVLEYHWDTDLLRWELERIPTGTRLTLRHTVGDRSWLARVAAGWHLCLDVLDLALSGERIGRIVGVDAKPYWEPLNAAYSQRLGVAQEKWPLE